MSRILLRRAILITAVASMILVHAWSLMRYPAPHADEAWLTSRAWAFAHTGRAFGALDSGVFDAYEHHWIANQWLVTALHSLALRLTGAPALLPLRIFSLLLGLGLLAVTWFLGRQVGGLRVGAASLLLLGSSLAFFYSAHLVRYDILAALLGYGALAAAWAGRQGRFRSGLAAGLLVGLAVETHPNSLIFVPAIGALYLLRWGVHSWRKAALWGFGLGLLAGLVYYLALHYFPDPETYRLITSTAFGETQQPPLLSGSLSVMLEGLGGVFNLLLVSAGPMVILAVAAAPVVIASRQPEARALLVLNGVMILTAALIIPNKTAHYAIYLAPAFLLLIAVFLVDFLGRPWRSRIWDYAARVVVWGSVAGALALSAASIASNPYRQYQQAQAEVNAQVRPGDTLIGPQVYWLGLTGHRYLSWELLFLYPRLNPGASLADAFRHFDVDVLVIDPSLRALIGDEVDPDSRWYHYHLPEKELMAFLDRQADLVLDSDADGLQVYRIRQPESTGRQP